jgi:dihydrofolate reductase
MHRQDMAATLPACTLYLSKNPMNFAHVVVSADLMMAGRDGTNVQPAGIGGRALWWWALRTRTVRQRFDVRGGTRSVDDDIVDATLSRSGAILVGRRTAALCHASLCARISDLIPVVVACRTLPALRQPRFEYVIGSAHEALQYANTLAASKDTWIVGGANLLSTCLAANLLDELWMSQVPFMLPGGLPLPAVPRERVGAIGVAQSGAHGRAIHSFFTLNRIDIP